MILRCCDVSIVATWRGHFDSFGMHLAAVLGYIARPIVYAIHASAKEQCCSAHADIKYDRVYVVTVSTTETCSA